MQPALLPVADKPKSSDRSPDSSKEREKNASGLQLSLPRRAQLAVALTGPTLAFIEPPNERGEGGKDAQIYGHVILRLPKTKRVKSLVVELVGHCNLGL